MCICNRKATNHRMWPEKYSISENLELKLFEIALLLLSFLSTDISMNSAMEPGLNTGLQRTSVRRTNTYLPAPALMSCASACALIVWPPETKRNENVGFNWRWVAFDLAVVGLYLFKISLHEGIDSLAGKILQYIQLIDCIYCVFPVSESWVEPPVVEISLPSCLAENTLCTLLFCIEMFFLPWLYQTKMFFPQGFLFL